MFHNYVHHMCDISTFSNYLPVKYSTISTYLHRNICEQKVILDTNKTIFIITDGLNEYTITQVSRVLMNELAHHFIKVCQEALLFED